MKHGFLINLSVNNLIKVLLENFCQKNKNLKVSNTEFTKGLRKPGALRNRVTLSSVFFFEVRVMPPLRGLPQATGSAGSTVTNTNSLNLCKFIKILP